MDIEEIEVTISADGNVQIVVNGVRGTRCMGLTRRLEHVLGDEVEERRLTAEIHDRETAEIVEEIRSKREGGGNAKD